MKKIMNFVDVETLLTQYVRPLNMAGGYKLDRITALMAYLGNPQDSYKAVHVAGTSGKTSTTYYVAAMLRAAGYNVGHTVSPHVDLISERAQINLQSLPETEYCTELSAFLEQIAPSTIDLSYFELLVAFAYWLFAKRNMDYVVVEVGLGGLLDGTNVITRPDKVCVITDIGLDHTNILGNTVEEIAAQKAGIIHKQNIVFMHQQAPEIMQVVQKRCQAENAQLQQVKPVYDEITKDLPQFQRRNWHLALSSANYVLQRDQATSLTVGQQETTLDTYIPARMETVHYKDKTIILDGSHNEQKIGALVNSLQAKYPNESYAMLVSFGENKADSVAASLSLLAGLADNIILTEFSLAQDHMRAPIPVELLSNYAHTAGFTTILSNTNPADAFKQLLARPENILLITGSFYLFNHLRPLLNSVIHSDDIV